MSASDKKLIDYGDFFGSLSVKDISTESTGTLVMAAAAAAK